MEARPYETSRGGGPSPTPQFCRAGYSADSPSPAVGGAAEAEGAAYHEGARLQRDHKRDWILRRAGWTVKRVHRTTIYHKPARCAYVIRNEVEGPRMWAAARAREEELRRQGTRAAVRHPFRKVLPVLAELL